MKLLLIALAVIAIAAYLIVLWRVIRFGLPHDDESIGDVDGGHDHGDPFTPRQAGITAAAFEARYAARSGITVERLRALGRVVLPCSCGEEGCEGWQSISEARAADIDWEDAWRDYMPRRPWE